jgi:hypothetical protein
MRRYDFGGLEMPDQTGETCAKPLNGSYGELGEVEFRRFESESSTGNRALNLIPHDERIDYCIGLKLM